MSKKAPVVAAVWRKRATKAAVKTNRKNYRSSITNKDAVQVEFIRFEYDVEKGAKAVEDSPLPNDYAEMLRMGF